MTDNHGIWQIIRCIETSRGIIPHVQKREVIQRLRDDVEDAADARALRRIVSRALASGQLEKLEDARPYLRDTSNVRCCGKPILFGQECSGCGRVAGH